MRLADQILQDAQTTGNGNEFDLGASSLHLGIYITSNGTTSGGTIQIETSDEPGYAGTWHPIGSAINASVTSADKKSYTAIVGCYRYIRARIASAITGGGTISVRLTASQ